MTIFDIHYVRLLPCPQSDFFEIAVIPVFRRRAEIQFFQGQLLRFQEKAPDNCCYADVKDGEDDVEFVIDLLYANRCDLKASAL